MKNLKVLLIPFVLTLVLIGCKAKTENQNSELNETKVTVYYFHGEQRCPTCIAVGDVSSELVKTKYADNKDVSFIEVNFSTKDGEAIADKYEIAVSSLLVVSGEKVCDLTNDAFSYAKTNPEKLKQILEDEINKNL
jgi:ABC-type Zn uptake system ZnuABC Zn-binding protein ZnuA